MVSKKVLVRKVTIFSHQFWNYLKIYDCLQILNMQQVHFTSHSTIQDHSIHIRVPVQIIHEKRCSTTKSLLYLSHVGEWDVNIGGTWHRCRCWDKWRSRCYSNRWYKVLNVSGPDLSTWSRACYQLEIPHWSLIKSNYVNVIQHLTVFWVCELCTGKQEKY